MGYMRSRSTLLVMDVQVELKTEIFWCKLKVLLLCGFFFFFIIASCSIGLVMLIQIALWEDLSARVFHLTVKFSSPGSELTTDGYESVGLEEGIPHRLRFS